MQSEIAHICLRRSKLIRYRTLLLFELGAGTLQFAGRGAQRFGNIFVAGEFLQVDGVCLLYTSCMSMGLYEKYEFPHMYTSPELGVATRCV